MREIIRMLNNVWAKGFLLGLSIAAAAAFAIYTALGMTIQGMIAAAISGILIALFLYKFITNDIWE